MTEGFAFSRPTTSQRNTAREDHGTPIPIEDAAFLRQTRIQETKPTSQNGGTHSIDWLTDQAVSEESNTPRRSVTLSEKYPKPTGTKMLFNNLQKQEASFTMPTMNLTVAPSNSFPSYTSPKATNALTTTSPSPIAPHRGTIGPDTPRTQKQDTVYKISGDNQCVKMFSNVAFRQKLVNNINKDYGVTLDIQADEADSFHSSIGYVLQLNGASINVMRAHEVIGILFERAFTKKVFGRSEGFVIYKFEAMKLIERLVDENEMLCLYQFSESDGLIISYFTSTSSSIKAVCMDEKTISSLIGKHFIGKSITIPKEWNDTMIDRYLQTMVEFCGKIYEEETVLFEKETDQYLVFGLRKSVETLLEAQMKLQKDFVINPCQLGFEQYQIQFLILNFQKDLKRLESDYRNLSILLCLKDNYFVGPTPIHTKVKELLNEMVANVTRSQFEIDDHHLGLTIGTQQNAIHQIASTYGCDAVVEIVPTSRTCLVPIATLAVNDAASTTTAMSVDIRVGDLAEQSVDMVVICSTSENLLKDILEKAGSAVENQVRTTLQNKNCRDNGFYTSGGDLLCRRLLFLPWLTEKLDDASARRSIHTFFSIAINHAIEHRQTSLAFPALGCGELKYDPNMIAEVILDEIQRYSDCNLNILIVLLSEDGTAYPAFCYQLANLRRKKPPKEQTPITYTHAVIKTTLTGHQENINKAVEAISTHTRNSVTSEQFNEFPLHSWSQPTIDAYFRYCIENCVLPKVDVTDEKLTLVGTKEDTMTTSREFYRIKSMKAEEARLASFARIAVWIYNTRQGYTKKYSLKLNALIEEAHHQRKKEICFRNDDNVDCRLNFKDMKEKSENEQRTVIRTDFQTPAEWAPQSTDIQRFRLEHDDPEYTKVLERFNLTMAGKYEIIRIERIQNKRWYTAYKTFLDYSQQLETEEYLFHGCPKTSADMIINTCFNRSFAGVNGIFYGVGVYFSRNAFYSHGCTRLNPTNNQRCMFLARVLVGKTTLGNQSMRVPPPGFDSTTDSKHIIVTYHDDQAYAEYLITYR